MVAGEQLIAEKQAVAGRAVRSAYQQQNSLVGLSIVLRGASPADIATGMQVQRNVFGIQGNAITNLNNAQAQLANKRAKVAEAEQAVAAAAGRGRPDGPAGHRADPAGRGGQGRGRRGRAGQAGRVQGRREGQEHRAGAVQQRSSPSGTGSQQILIARAKAEKAAAARRKAAAEKAERAKAKKENRPPRTVPDDPATPRRLS